MSLTAGGLIEILEKHPKDTPIVVMDRTEETACKAGVWPALIEFECGPDDADERMSALAIGSHGPPWRRR